MATLYTQQSSNITKTWILMIGFFGLVIALGFAFSYVYNNQSILYISVIIALVMNFASYWWSDKIALGLNGAQEMPDEGRFREVHNIVENLAITAGLPKPRLYVVNDPAPNAFATGRNPEHAAVAVTTGLMEILDRSEMEGVLAHELSHVGNRDILVSTVAVVLAGFIAILADFFLRMSLFGGNRENRNVSPVIIIFALVIAVLAPIAATLIQLAISRRREYLADASGALLTRYPEGLASALEKISSFARPMQKANHATAHLFIANPFGREGGLQASISRLFSTHPPAEDRISILRQMK